MEIGRPARGFAFVERGNVAKLPFERAPDASTLTAVAELVATPFADADAAIDATLTLICDLFGVGLAMVHRLAGDHLVITHACDRLGLDLRLPITIRRQDTFCDLVLAAGTPLVVPDAERDPRFDDLVGKRLVGTRTYLGVPIRLGDGRLFGTLCAHDRRVLQLGSHELAALVILARIIASQLERSEALSMEVQTARHLAQRNAELAEAVGQLHTLHEIVESVSAELDLSSLLERVIASAVQLLGAYAGAISLIGDGPETTRRLTAMHNLPEDLRSRAYPAGAGLMGEVIAARGPVVVARYQDLTTPLTDSIWSALAPWVAVPIWWREEIIGTFGIAANDATRQFGPRDIVLLTQLAAHAAVAIENARLYAASRELGVVEERNRLAREIHDTLAQSLLSLMFQLRSAQSLVAMAPARAVEELTAAEERARAALEEARRSIWNLGPASLAAGNLSGALRGELAALPRTGPAGNLVVSGPARPLPPEAQHALFRVAQEALTNAGRHAGATRIDLTLAYGTETVTLTIEDDGTGFDPEAAARRRTTTSGGYGLISMSERLRLVGGSLAIESLPTRAAGTRVIATVPYEGRGAPPGASTVRRPAPSAPPQPIRVVVVDDHPPVRRGIAALLADQPGIEVVADGADGEDALRLVESLRPDVLVIDLRMPRLSGVEAIARVVHQGGPTRCLAVTIFAQDELVLEALRAGARGYLLKDASGDELAAAVRTVHGGGIAVSPHVAGKLAAGLIAPMRLTGRERDVLTLLSHGRSDKEIAADLGMSVKTANFHVANVLAKLGAQNRAEAVRLAYARGLLDD
jgi:signal transduction histidine kinase/DNA-binding NarL/FixJ family response regulator